MSWTFASKTNSRSLVFPFYFLNLWIITHHAEHADSLLESEGRTACLFSRRSCFTQRYTYEVQYEVDRQKQSRNTPQKRISGADTEIGEQRSCLSTIFQYGQQSVHTKRDNTCNSGTFINATYKKRKYCTEQSTEKSVAGEDGCRIG